MADRRPKFEKVAEVLLGGLAKGTMILVGIAAVVLAVLSGDGLRDLPTTRKEWGYFLLTILIVITAFISFIGLRHFSK